MPHLSRPLALAFALFLVASATPARGQVARLLRDVDPGWSEHAADLSSYPSQLTAVGAKVAFVARDRDLWFADATTGRAAPIADLCPQCHPATKILTTRAGRLFFHAADSLWASDGTAAGTFALPDPGIGARAVFAESGDLAATLPQALLFAAGHPDGSLRLWRTDGTSEGSAEVATLVAPGAPLRFLAARALGSRAVFAFRSLLTPTLELWSSDGTSAGTRAIAPIVIQGSSEQVWRATATHVFFTIVTPGQGEELWASDGTTAGTRAVSSFTAPHPFSFNAWKKPLGKYLYFLADDITHGVELWRSDGTPPGTTRITNFGYSDAFEDWSPSAGQDWLEEIGGKVVFYATDGFGPLQLWTSTGSPTSVKPLGGPCSGACFAGDGLGLRRIGNRLLFDAYFAESGTELWSTDGTSAGTKLMRDICPGPCSSAPTNASLAGSRLYFVAVRDAASGDQELWSTDGSAAGTYALTDFESPFPLDFDMQVVVTGDRAWFSAEEAPYGRELWSSPAPGIVELAVDATPGAATSNPRSLTVLGERVLFHACEDERTSELWAGTAEPATALPITAFGRECLLGGDEAQLVASGDRVFFLFISDDGGKMLFSTDGTPGGLAAATAFGRDDRIASPLVPVDGGVAFAVQPAGTNDHELWYSDGTVAGTGKRLDLPNHADELWPDGTSIYFDASGTGPIRHIWRADLADGSLRQLTELGDGGSPYYSKLGNLVYFSPNSGEVWKTDGTPGGTSVAFTLPPTGGHYIAGMVSRGGALYFHTARYVQSPHQIWRSDGTQQGTIHLITVGDPEASTTPPRGFTALGGRVFYNDDDGVQGRELWSTDGTPAGTQLVRDLYPGPHGADPAELVAAGGRLYFVATDRAHGREVWQTDGTAAGTRLVHDIAPGPLSSAPGELTASAAALFFDADDGLIGREPWVLPLAGPAGCATSETMLCLGGGRFRVEAVWNDFAGNTGVGHAAALTSNTGTFWFFSSSNVEVILKVLDGRGLNDHQWVFYGALSSVEYTLTVTDTQTGAVRRYFNPAGRLASIGDTEAFGPRGASAAALRRQSRLGGDASPPPLVATRRDAAAKSVCVTSATRLCLAGDRFAVEVAWRDFAGNRGVGTATSLSADTGDFWFFSADNVELVVKVLDGRPVNGKFWLFYGALSSVEYTLTVTDTETGTVRTYANPSGRLASFADTSAF